MSENKIGIRGGESSAYTGTVELAPADSKDKMQTLDVSAFYDITMIKLKFAISWIEKGIALC